MEPGEIAFPQRPVLSIAITDPKWVRAYVSEPDMGRLRSGHAHVRLAVDTFPNRRFEDGSGSFRPSRSSRPRTVQTEDLRTSLVYEVRVFVKDPGDELRLGMPATVYLAGEYFKHNRRPQHCPTSPVRDNGKGDCV